MARARRRTRAWMLVGLVGLGMLAGVALQRRVASNDILRTVTLGWSPYRIALDTRAGRAFVMGASGNTATGFSGRLATLDTTSGALLRTVTLGPNPTDMVVDEGTSRVFITDIVDGMARVLDARTGALLRTVAVGQMEPHDVERIAVDTRGNHVFVSAAAVQALDARTGASGDVVFVGGGSLAVATRAGRVFSADYETNTVRVMDVRDGRLMRAVGVTAAPLHFAVSARAGRVFVAGDAGVSVLDARTGQVIRTVSIGAARFAPMAVDEATARVFIATPTGVITLDAYSGRIIHTVPVRDPGGMVIDTRHGRAFVTLGNGVGVLDARSGVLSRTVAIGAHPSVAAIDERSGHVFVVDRGTMDANGNLTGPGSIGVLDARSGAVLRAITVGVYPGPMAVDERTEHIFVVNDGGPVRVSDPWGWVPPWLRRRLPLLPPPPSSTRTVPGSVNMIDATR